VHRTFPGYLAIKWRAAQEGASHDLRPNIKEFFDVFLKVPGGPAGKPYVVPFCEEAASEDNLWLNRNVAGSYAQSSLRRDVSPLLRVVSVSGSRRETRYSLQHKHWELARTHLAQEGRIPVVPLAALLFRDYGFEPAQPSLSDIVRIFRDTFGYATAPSDAEFSHLFSDDSSSRSASNWFEVLA
jgi:hypothetical protein